MHTGLLCGQACASYASWRAWLRCTISWNQVDIRMSVGVTGGHVSNINERMHDRGCRTRWHRLVVSQISGCLSIITAKWFVYDAKNLQLQCAIQREKKESNEILSSYSHIYFLDSP